jgi:hypothetical protein
MNTDKMYYPRSGVFLAVLILFTAGVGMAQPEHQGGSFVLGVFGGASFTHYSTNTIALLSEEPTCFTAKDGGGRSQVTGITADLTLDAATMREFVSIRLAYHSMRGTFDPLNEGSTQVLTKYNGETAVGYVRTTMSSDLTYVMLGLGFKYYLFSGRQPNGPNLSLLLETGLSSNNTITSRVEVNAAHLGSSAVGSSNHDADKLRFSILPSLGFDIPLRFLSERLILAPTIGYDLPLSSIKGVDWDWRVSSIVASVGINMVIGTEPNGPDTL